MSLNPVQLVPEADVHRDTAHVAPAVQTVAVCCVFYLVRKKKNHAGSPDCCSSSDGREDRTLAAISQSGEHARLRRQNAIGIYSTPCGLLQSASLLQSRCSCGMHIHAKHPALRVETNHQIGYSPSGAVYAAGARPFSPPDIYRPGIEMKEEVRGKNT